MSRGKIIFILTITIILSITIARVQKSKSQPGPTQKSSRPQSLVSQAPKVERVNSSIFIPYWNIPDATEGLEKYDTLIYFGVAPNGKGDLKIDEGMLNLDKFANSLTRQLVNKKTMLTVRMLDAETNLKILENPSYQQSLIRQTLEIVEKYRFHGVVLDLEVGVLPTDSVKKQISDFSKEFSNQTRLVDHKFYMTIYGDTFYRHRPYDVKSLATFIDGFYVMAYDFHKSRGEPGPNFPLTRRSPARPAGGLGGGGPDEITYGYDFQTMITDFSSVVPQEKLTVIFGMYGYDWTLGAQGKPLKVAIAIPLYEIEEKIVPNCLVQGIGSIPFLLTASPRGAQAIVRKKISSHIPVVHASDRYSNCVLIKNKFSYEKSIKYIDSDGYSHEVWYEDSESVGVKIEHLKSKGIGQIGYWVWGYFD